MESEKIHLCKLCHSDFENKEDLSFHTCVEIKQELQDSKVLDNYDVFQNYDLDLSEEFLSGILKLVDELCDAIRNGDPDFERTLEVNENLNNSVSCYRHKLLFIDSKFDKNESNAGTKKEDHFLEDLLPHSENEYFENDNNIDIEYSPKVTKGKKKKKVSNAKNSKEVTNSDTRTKQTLKMEILKKEIDDVLLFPYIKYISDTDFQCSICNRSHNKKPHVLRHLRTVHRNGIKLNNDSKDDQNLPQKYDCESKTCRKLYGPHYRQLWCTQCK